MTRAELQQRNRPVTPRPIVAGAEFRNFGEQLLAVREAELAPHRRDPRLDAIQKRAATGAGESVPSDGGFAVGSEFAQAIVSKAYATGAFLARASKLPIAIPNRNTLIVPGFDEQSRANGSRFGGVQVNWLEEGVSITASKAKFRRIELTPRRLIGLCYTTDELQQDANNLGAVMEQAFGSELSYVTEKACITGSGAGMPLGILNSNALITVTKETGQAAGTIVAENTEKMWARCWGPARSSAFWFINPELEPQLLRLALAVGSAGSAAPLYVPTQDPENQPFNLLLGRPVIPVEWCAAVGSVGDIIFASPEEYLLSEKGGPQTALSLHVRFIQGEDVYRFSWRVDGAPAWHTPLTPLNGSNTVSPFVTLAAR